MKKSNNKKGFTLVELVIVVAVIAILSAILIPTIGTVIKDAKDAAVKSDLRTVITNKMAETEEDVPTGYFFYKEKLTDTAYTYILKWDGSEITICSDIELKLELDGTEITVANVAADSTDKSKMTVTPNTSNSTYDIAIPSDAFGGNFYQLKITKKLSNTNP